MVDSNVQRAIFDPVERAILSDYFHVARTADIRDIDIHAPGDERDPGSDEVRVRLRPDQDGTIGAYALPNAVARIALNRIQGALPQWYQGNGDGANVFGRDEDPKLRRDVQLKPVFLFSINWADSGPGFSWPADFYATWIPGFDRFVVTESVDSPDCYGYTDIALGHFPGRTDITRGSRRVLVADWRSKSHYQAKWEDFLSAGLVDEDEAETWVRGVLLHADNF